MKSTIKKLSQAISRILDDNAEANYYNGLIDCGEWSSTAPDFRRVIQQFELTRTKLNEYIDFAEEMAHQFHDQFPHHVSESWERQINPWWIIRDNLTCIFMAEAFENESILL